MAHRSNSQLSTFTRCGEQYFLERVAKVPEPPAVYLLGGSAVHSAIEHYELSGREADTDDVLDHFYVDFERRVALAERDYPDRSKWRTGGRRSKEWPNKEDVSFWEAMGPRWVSMYIGFAETSPWRIWTLPTGEPAVEVGFELDFDGVSVKGFIDQIVEYPGGELVVRDIKSGSRAPADVRQLGLYRVAVGRLFGVIPEWGDYYMARTGELTSPDPLTAWSEEYLAEQFVRLEKAIESRLFIAAPGQNCVTCGVKRFCRAVGGDLAHEVPLYLERGEAAVLAR